MGEGREGRKVYERGSPERVYNNTITSALGIATVTLYERVDG